MAFYVDAEDQTQVFPEVKGGSRNACRCAQTQEEQIPLRDPMTNIDYLRSSLIGYPPIMMEPLSKSGGHLYTCKKDQLPFMIKVQTKVGIEDYTLT